MEGQRRVLQGRIERLPLQRRFRQPYQWIGTEQSKADKGRAKSTLDAQRLQPQAFRQGLSA